VFEGFLLYCVQDADRKITPVTADGYVTAVLKMIEHLTGNYNTRTGARSPRYLAVYKALRRQHAGIMPLRLRTRIPFTVPFLLWAFTYVKQHYPDPAFQRLLIAAMAAGHCFSLRVGEFLKSPHYDPVTEANRSLRAHTTMGWYGDRACPATAAQTWPEGDPEYITSVLDVRKNTTEAILMALESVSILIANCVESTLYINVCAIDKGTRKCIF
jgi:hypothetical protein